MADETTTRPTINSWAISVLQSRTMWFNAASLAIAILALTEVAALVPVRFLPLQAAIVAAVNLWLRTVTTRPVAFVGPGETAIVQLPKIDPPAPKAVTD